MSGTPSRPGRRGVRGQLALVGGEARALGKAVGRGGFARATVWMLPLPRGIGRDGHPCTKTFSCQETSGYRICSKVPHLGLKPPEGQQ